MSVTDSFASPGGPMMQRRGPFLFQLKYTQSTQIRICESFDQNY
jgi:hypothetical protein